MKSFPHDEVELCQAGVGRLCVHVLLRSNLEVIDRYGFNPIYPIGVTTPELTLLCMDTDTYSVITDTSGFRIHTFLSPVNYS